MMSQRAFMVLLTLFISGLLLTSPAFGAKYINAATRQKMAIVAHNMNLTIAAEKKINDEYSEGTYYLMTTKEAGEAGFYPWAQFTMWRKGNMSRSDDLLFNWKYSAYTTLNVGDKTYTYDVFTGENIQGETPATFEGKDAKSVQAAQQQHAGDVDKEKLTEKQIQDIKKAAQDMAKRIDIIYTGMDTVSERKCYAFKTLSKKDPTQYVQTWFDTYTSTPVKIVISMKISDEVKPLKMSAIYSDFYVYNPRVIRARMAKMYLGSVLFGKIVCKNYRINAGMSDSVFSREALRQKYDDLKNQMIADWARAAAEEAKNQAIEGAKEQAKEKIQEQIPNLFRF